MFNDELNGLSARGNDMAVILNHSGYLEPFYKRNTKLSCP